MRGAMMKKILVVDDEENIRLLYQEELEEEGYTVEVAAHGQEAISSPWILGCLEWTESKHCGRSGRSNGICRSYCAPHMVNISRI
jgi:hypothetical protein